MGVHTYSLTAAVDPRVVWERWLAVEDWPDDDASLAQAKLNGPLAKGAVGWVKPKKGVRRMFRIVEVDQARRRLVTSTSLPLARMEITRSVSRAEASAAQTGDGNAAADGTYVLSYVVTVTGVLAGLWDRSWAHRMRKDVPAALMNLAAAAS